MLHHLVSPDNADPFVGVVGGVAMDLNRPTARQGDLRDDLRLSAVDEPPDTPSGQLRPRVGMLILAVKQHEFGWRIKESHTATLSGPPLPVLFEGHFHFRGEHGVQVRGWHLRWRRNNVDLRPGPRIASGFFASWAIARGDSGMAAVFFAIVGLGALLTLVGFFVLIAAAHRALVEIDALQTQGLGYYSESAGRSGSSRVS